MALVSPVNMNSVMLVRDELLKSLASALQNAEQWVPECIDDSSISSAMAEMSQVNGILRVLEFGGAVELSEAVLALVQVLEEREESRDEIRLRMAQRGLRTLQAYLEYCVKERHTYPLVVNSMINELRCCVQRPVLFEAEQVGFELIQRPGDDQMRSCAHLMVDDIPRIKRLQHMYQVGLLGVLHDGNNNVHLRLMECAVARLSREYSNLAEPHWWLLVGAALRCFGRGHLRLNLPRKRLLAGVDRVLRARLRSGSDVPMRMSEEQLPEWVHLLTLAGAEASFVRPVTAQYGCEVGQLDDRQLARIEQALLARDDQALSGQGQVLRDELYRVKELLNSHGESLDQQAVTQLTSHLHRIGAILGDAGFNRLKGLLSDRLVQFTQYLSSARGGAGSSGVAGSGQHSLAQLAEALLVVEGTLAEPENFSDQALPDNELCSAMLAGSAREEAIGVVLNESKAAIQLAKRGITAYLDSDFDADHIANVSVSLSMVRGAFDMLEYRRAVTVLERCCRYIDSWQNLSDASPPTRSSIETLADALISVEYYLDELTVSDSHNEELLAIAEESLAELGGVDAVVC